MDVLEHVCICDVFCCGKFCQWPFCGTATFVPKVGVWEIEDEISWTEKYINAKELQQGKEQIWQKVPLVYNLHIIVYDMISKMKKIDLCFQALLGNLMYHNLL